MSSTATAAPSHVTTVTATALTPTPERHFGPFYVKDSPIRAKLYPVWAQAKSQTESDSLPTPGQLCVIKCTINCANAVIDLWQADPENNSYDYKETDGIFRPYLTYIGTVNDHSTSDEYAYRCTISSGSRGSFEIETLIPPAYFDPEDSTWRCPHIHFYIHDCQGYKPLVTQVMFEGPNGEPLEKNATDNHIMPMLTLRLRPATKNNRTWWETNFNIVLKAF